MAKNLSTTPADVDKLLKENERRIQAIHSPFNPVTGLNSVGKRQEIVIPDFMRGNSIWLPTPMFNQSKILKQVSDCGSIQDFLIKNKWDLTKDNHDKVAEALIRSRFKHDFPFWAATQVNIKPKGGGEDIKFWLNRPQRTRLIPAFEVERLNNKPIRLVVDKARQWGGSTGTQIYDSWLQTNHQVGLNSLIVGHISAAAIEVEDMFVKMLDQYPTKLLYPMGARFNPKESKFKSVFGHPNIHRIPQRNCKIKIGTAENPESARGGDYNLVHCTEVGLWRNTEKMTPEQIVQSATSGVLLKPYTSIVYESTAKGTGNFFHREYQAAKEGQSQFKPLFVAWYEIDQYSQEFTSNEERMDFARWLWDNRNDTHPKANREESGRYHWNLWAKGATLEAINWYVQERRKYNDSAYMYSEYPSDDVEAFVYSGAKVFDRYKVEAFRKACNESYVVGDVYGEQPSGKDALKNLKFVEDPTAELWVWEKPDVDPDEEITNRYIVSVDIGGRGIKADWSVICVIDRYWLLENDKPCVVAQMRYHTDMDLLAWKAAQIASYYDNALLVIESNTLETKDRDRYVDGDNAPFILDQIRDIYPNLYARKQSLEDIKQGVPKKYGFHTNVQTKPTIIANLVKFVREHLYVERDTRVLDEFLQYERRQNGSFGAIVGYHDDLLMSRALALYVSAYEMDPPQRLPRNRNNAILTQSPISEATI